MREILFRGKRLGDGEWVDGSLFIDDKGEKHEILIGYVNYRVSWEVDPETVGQYTGLTDKNGTRIFEGDVVEFCDIKGVVNYNTGCFCVKTNKPDWKSRNNPAIDIVFCEYENEVEVIGNIHDNPELIGGRKDNG